MPGVMQMRKIVVWLWIVTLLLVSFAWAAPKKYNAPVVPPVAAKTESVPEAYVMLEGRQLIPIKVSVLSFTPADRARAVTGRINKLIRDPFFNVDQIKTHTGDITTDIVVGDTILMSVTDADATAAGKSRSELAQSHMQILKASIAAHIQEYSARSLAFSAAYALLATLGLVIVLALLSRIKPRILSRLEAWRGVYIRSLRVQSIELLHHDRIVAIIATAIKAFHFASVVVLLNLYLPLVLSFFPWTRPYSSKYLDYIMAPLERVGSGIATYLPNIFYIVVIVFITHLIIRLTRFLFSEVGKGTLSIPGFFPEWADPTFNIVKFLIIAFAVVAAFPYLPGSESPAFKGVSVFLGVLISFGSSSAISNIVAGVILTYTRAFRLGDRIQIGETVGDVIETNLLVTRVRTIKHVDITVPNSMVLGSHITNYSSAAKEYGLILHTTVTIGYDAPWRQVHELLLAAARSTENILELPAPFVLQTSLDDFYVSYQINAYTDKPSIMARTYSELHQNIQEKFNEAGVEIMSPHYGALRDGNMTTIPEAFLSNGYVPPVFGVKVVTQPLKNRPTDIKGQPQ